MGHGKIVCSCGAVLAQCRCMNHGGVLEKRDRACVRCLSERFCPGVATSTTTSFADVKKDARPAPEHWMAL